MSLVSVLLVIHVSMALGLVLPSLLLPFALRARRPASAPPARIMQGLTVIQARGSLMFGLGVGLSGMALLAALGSELLGEPWLVAALVLYTLTLAVAFFVQRPKLRRILGSRAAGDDRDRKDRARGLRYVSYLMALLVGLIAFLMSAKPRLP